LRSFARGSIDGEAKLWANSCASLSANPNSPPHAIKKSFSCGD
jgi:hypothetical protein